MSYLDSLLAVQRRPESPEDELRDVNARLFDRIRRGITASDILPQDEIVNWVQQLSAQGDTMQKAVVLNEAAYRRQYPDDYVPRRDGHKGILYVNELGVVGPYGAERWREKGDAYGFQFLSYVCRNVDVLAAIILTRQRQMSAFTRPYDENDNHPLGYRWKRLDGEKLTKDDRKECRRLDAILQSSGTETDPIVMDWDLQRRTFPEFTEALIHDTLTAAVSPIETIPANDGSLLGWHNLDFETIRLAYEHGYDGDDRIVGVQITPDEHLPIVGFERDELVYPMRNPITTLRANGYPTSETELFIKAATAYLNSFTFNAAAQDRNTMPRGLMTMYGQFDQAQMTVFREQWNAHMRGAQRRWQIPVLFARDKQAGGAVWTKIDDSTNEMYLVKWFTFLISIGCALHGMDPVEINMESFSSKVSSLSGKDTSEKLQSSHDRGFIPLAGWYEGVVNRRIVGRLTRKYAIAWVGLYPDDEERKHERQKLSLTVNEMRELDDEAPHPDEDLGNAPVNPTLMSVYNIKLTQKLGLGAPGEPGAPGAGGGEGDAFGLPKSEQPPPYARDESGRTAQPNGNRPGTPPAARPGFQKARLVVEIQELPPAVEWPDDA